VFEATLAERTEATAVFRESGTSGTCTPGKESHHLGPAIDGIFFCVSALSANLRSRLFHLFRDLEAAGVKMDQFNNLFETYSEFLAQGAVAPHD